MTKHDISEHLWKFITEIENLQIPKKHAKEFADLQDRISSFGRKFRDEDLREFEDVRVIGPVEGTNYRIVARIGGPGYWFGAEERLSGENGETVGWRGTDSLPFWLIQKLGRLMEKEAKEKNPDGR